jgi:hypothetical protein
MTGLASVVAPQDVRPDVTQSTVAEVADVELDVRALDPGQGSRALAWHQANQRRSWLAYGVWVGPVDRPNAWWSTWCDARPASRRGARGPDAAGAAFVGFAFAPKTDVLDRSGVRRSPQSVR